MLLDKLTVRNTNCSMVHTPCTVGTKTDFGDTPPAVSDISYVYSDADATQTEEEAGIDIPVPSIEYSNIYKEGVHADTTLVAPERRQIQ